MGGPEPVESLGALKKFIIPPDSKQEEAKAVERLESEVQALRTLRDQPGILRLLHANVAQRFIVTEYHRRGTLDKHLNLFRGKVLAPLEAFSPLVEAVRRIHEKGTVHREFSARVRDSI